MLTTESEHNYSFEDHNRRLQKHSVLLYMKGTPKEPLCGFSQLVVQILEKCGVSFETVNVMNPDIRQALKQISKWPTFPQLYIQGKFIGGSDIVAELYRTNELQQKLNQDI